MVTLGLFDLDQLEVHSLIGVRKHMTLVKEQGATRRLTPADFFPQETPPTRRAAKLPPDRYGKTPNFRPEVPKPRPSFGLRPIPARPGFGLRTGLRLGRFIPGIGMGLGVGLMLYDFYDIYRRYSDPNRPYQPNPENGWVKCWGDCIRRTPPNHSSNLSNCTPSNMCLGGQSLGEPNGILPPTTTNTGYLISIGIFVSGAWRHTLHSRWTRPSAAKNNLPLTVPQNIPFIPLDPELDPNLLRDAPSLPMQATPPRVRELTVPDVLERLDKLTDRSFEVQTPRTPLPLTPRPKLRPGIGIGLNPAPGAGEPLPGMQPVPKPGTKPKPDEAPKVRQVPPHRRTKPKFRERQKKVRGPLFAFFAIADAISEAAEVVDALFEALPESVQKRWSKGRTARKFIDNAGQYGIDGADWKLQAVFHNFHLIDGAEAVKNIIANQAEDKLIGSLHKNLPKNFINANEDGQKAYAKLVDELLKSLGLK